jgi:hypothetical protein
LPLRKTIARRSLLNLKSATPSLASLMRLGPLRRGFVFLFRERHLPRGLDALGQRHQVDIGLAPGFLPVWRRQRVEQPLAVGARRRRCDLLHLLQVEEGHGPRGLSAGQRDRDVDRGGGEEQPGRDGNRADGR